MGAVRRYARPLDRLHGHTERSGAGDAGGSLTPTCRCSTTSRGAPLPSLRSRAGSLEEGEGMGVREVRSARTSHQVGMAGGELHRVAGSVRKASDAIL